MTSSACISRLARTAAVVGTIIFLVIGPLLPRLVDISTYQQQIVTLLEDALKRKISLGECASSGDSARNLSFMTCMCGSEPQ